MTRGRICLWHVTLAREDLLKTRDDARQSFVARAGAWEALPAVDEVSLTVTLDEREESLASMTVDLTTGDSSVAATYELREVSAATTLEGSAVCVRVKVGVVASASHVRSCRDIHTTYTYKTLTVLLFFVRGESESTLTAL